MTGFQKATKHQAKLRMALTGPSGSGKTYTALRMATALGGSIAVIDTEHGSASKYADEFQFDTTELTYFSPDTYIQAIKLAERSGYGVLIIDSLTHAWNAEGGVLDIANGKFGGWKDATPAHNALIQAILSSKLHVIATMRSKTDYAVEVDEKTKRQTVTKLGTAPVQRDGMEYEFDVVGDLDWSHTMRISKTRCRALDGKTMRLPGEDVVEVLQAWLNAGEAPPPFGPMSARAAIAALPGATAEDIAAAADLDDRDLLRELYKEIKARPATNGKMEEVEPPL